MIVPVVSLVTPKLNKADVDEIFSCYEKTYTVVVTERERIDSAKIVKSVDEITDEKVQISKSNKHNGSRSGNNRKNRNKRKK